MTTATDIAERSPDIAPSAETLRAIVSEPGWWVSDGSIAEHEIVDPGDGTFRAVDPTSRAS